MQQNIVNIGNTTADPVTTIQSYIAGGQIISSSLVAGYAIGYGSVTVGNATDNEFRYDAKGDANLDGTVNDTDLLTLLHNYGQTTTLWASANFEYNSSTPTLNTTVNDADLLDLLHTYGVVVAGPMLLAQAKPPAARITAAAAASPVHWVQAVHADSIIGSTDALLLDDSLPANQDILGGQA